MPSPTARSTREAAFFSACPTMMRCLRVACAPLRSLGSAGLLRLLFVLRLPGVVVVRLLVPLPVAVDVEVPGVDADERGARAAGDADMFTIVELGLVPVVAAHAVLAVSSLRSLA